jgi:hypothetical protein
MSAPTRTETRINTAKLVDLYVWALKQHRRKEAGLPSEWNQSAWLTRRAESPLTVMGGCGTACCFAGKTVLDAGYVPVYYDGDYHLGWNGAEDGDDTEYVINVEKFLLGEEDMDTEDAKRSTEDVAREILGLNYDEAWALFTGDNNIEDARRVISVLFEKAGEPLPEILLAETGEEPEGWWRNWSGETDPREKLLAYYV